MTLMSSTGFFTRANRCVIYILMRLCCRSNLPLAADDMSSRCIWDLQLPRYGKLHSLMYGDPKRPQHSRVTSTMHDTPP